MPNSFSSDVSERCSPAEVEWASSPYGAHTVALALSGGNALAAYQAGAYQALHERAIEPARVAGASAGAINGAIICGNARGQRLDALRSLWHCHDAAVAKPHTGLGEEIRRTAGALWAMTAGEPGIFAPRLPLGSWLNPFKNSETVSLYDSMPLGRTMERLVDFDRLNRGEPRFSATAIDLETGEDVVFDTRDAPLGPQHLRASSALLPAFPPVEMNGRLFGDGGLSANLPIDGILSSETERPLLCIAIDLLSLRGPRPRTLGEAAIRAQDLMFATQSRRALAAWQAIYDERAKHRLPPTTTVIYIAYSDHDHEVSGKAFDFTTTSASARWRAGYEDLGRALDDLASGRLGTPKPGLTVLKAEEIGGKLTEVHWKIAPPTA